VQSGRQATTFQKNLFPAQSGLPEDYSISSFVKWELISKAWNRHSSPHDNLITNAVPCEVGKKLIS